MTTGVQPPRQPLMIVRLNPGDGRCFPQGTHDQLDDECPEKNVASWCNSLIAVHPPLLAPLPLPPSVTAQVFELQVAVYPGPAKPAKDGHSTQVHRQMQLHNTTQGLIIGLVRNNGIV